MRNGLRLTLHVVRVGEEDAVHLVAHVRVLLEFVGNHNLTVNSQQQEHAG